MLIKAILFSTLLFWTCDFSYCQVPIKDDKFWIESSENCKIYNPYPQKKETITWSGECKNGFATGQGVIKWYLKGELSIIVKGSLIQGKLEGFVKMQDLKNNSTFEGNYSNGLKNGHGKTIQFKTDSTVNYTYSGNFKNDLFHGVGKQLFYKDGDSMIYYHGNFDKGKLKGKVYAKEFNDPIVWVCNCHCQDSNFQGEVELWYYKHDTLLFYYKGEMEKNIQHGYGTIQQGSNRYEGYWKNGLKEGQGALYYKSQLIYEGEWRKDQFDGIGKRVYPDGSTYIGEFKNHMRHGFGIMIWPDGKKFIGEFKDDLFNGYGYSTISKSLLPNLSGLWESGQFVQTMDVRMLIEKFEDQVSSLEANLR